MQTLTSAVMEPPETDETTTEEIVTMGRRNSSAAVMEPPETDEVTSPLSEGEERALEEEAFGEPAEEQAQDAAPEAPALVDGKRKAAEKAELEAQNRKLRAELDRIDRDTYERVRAELEKDLVRILGNIEGNAQPTGKAIKVTILVPNTLDNRLALALIDGPQVTVTACRASLERRSSHVVSGGSPADLVADDDGQTHLFGDDGQPTESAKAEDIFSSEQCAECLDNGKCEHQAKGTRCPLYENADIDSENEAEDTKCVGCKISDTCPLEDKAGCEGPVPDDGSEGDIDLCAGTCGRAFPRATTEDWGMPGIGGAWLDDDPWCPECWEARQTTLALHHWECKACNVWVPKGEACECGKGAAT